MRARHSFVLSLLGLAAAVGAQRTWIIDAAGGQGHDFRPIGAGIAVAAAGDTLLVRTGTYVESGLDIAEGLTIVADGVVRLESPAFGTGLLVHDLAAHERFVMRGFELGGFALNGHFSAQRCRGLVALHEVQTGLADTLGINFVDCAQVDLSRGFVRGGVASRDSGTVLRGVVVEGLVGWTVLCDGGSLVIDEATITGGNSPLNGFEAVHLTRGELRVSRCQVRSLPNRGGLGKQGARS